VGEFIAAKYHSMPLPVFSNDMRAEVDFTQKIDMDCSSMPPYDKGLAARVWECGFILRGSDVAILRSAFRGQRNGTRPSLVVMNSDVNDAMVCFLSPVQATGAGPDIYNVRVTFTEVPRVR